MIENEVKYFEFEEPIKCLVIATNEDEAVYAYEKEVAGCTAHASFVELSQSDFVDRLSVTETDAMPTIERGLGRATIDTQNALFLLKETGDPAIVLSAVSIGV